MKHAFSDVQAGFRKGRGTRDQIANIHWIIEKAKVFQKNITCFTEFDKSFKCVDHNKLWKVLKEMGLPDHLTCLLSNLYAGSNCSKQQLEPDMEQQNDSKLGKESFSFLPTSLFIIGSRFIHLVWTHSNVYLFYGGLITPKLLYPFICQWTSRFLPCSSYCK